MTYHSILGKTLVPGRASGPLLHADVGLSFWGGIAPETGIVIDSHHPLRGQSVVGKVLALPSGRGSCTGSAILLELIANGTAPAAIVFCENETILPLGALVSEELFAKSIPMVRIPRGAFDALRECKTANVANGRIDVQDACIPARDERDVAHEEVVPDVELADLDRDMLEGKQGPARRIAMRIILAIARLQGARRLIDVRQCHLDCCIYTGPVSVQIAERMRDLGAEVKVPTTLNAISIDRRNWRMLGVPKQRAEAIERQTDAYLAMGARPSFTCAPYLLDGAPGIGDHVGWAESNAVAFANSVLGAKTAKYPDYLDLCVALTGRAPYGECHLDENRKARAHIHVEVPTGADDAFYPLLGYVAGTLSPHEIPVLTGLETTAPSRDDLKAFAAAFATTSAAPMFHIVGITPEAPDLATAIDDGALEPIWIGRRELIAAWESLNSNEVAPVSCIAIGNPHSSFEEMVQLARHCAGRTKSGSTQAMITTGRDMHMRAKDAGVVAALEKFGFQFIVDTCWCMLEEPVIPNGPGGFLTNSGKYVHYGPGLTGQRVRFASLAACVEAASSGVFNGLLPKWLAGDGYGREQ